MARLARIVVPGYPHHVTQRGNRRQETFFGDADYLEYIRLMSHCCKENSVEIWAYCLMPNHVHLIVVPKDAENLAKAIGEAHKRYTRYINDREGWKGYLWQGRFASCVLDQRHLIAAARYVELNPVRAGLVKNPGDYKWSSAGAHLSGKGDEMVSAAPLLRVVSDWEKFLNSGMPEQEAAVIQKHSRTGRPLGDHTFLEKVEKIIGRQVQLKKPGPKIK